MAIVNDDKMIGEGVAQEVINFFSLFALYLPACTTYVVNYFSPGLCPLLGLCVALTPIKNVLLKIRSDQLPCLLYLLNK